MCKCKDAVCKMQLRLGESLWSISVFVSESVVSYGVGNQELVFL